MTLPIEIAPDMHPVNTMLKNTVLAALSFLTALELRDLLSKTINAFLPDKINDRLIFQLFLVLVIILVTVLAVSYWS